MLEMFAAQLTGAVLAAPASLQNALDLHSQDPTSFIWVAFDAGDEQEINLVSQALCLHELVVEDLLHDHRASRLERHGQTTLTVKTAHLDAQGDLHNGEVVVCVGDRFLLSVCHGEHSDLSAVRTRLKERPHLVEHGPSAVLYAILNHLIDEYEPVVQSFDQAIQALEEQVFSDHPGDVTERVYALKRQVLELHRGVAPLEGPMDLLANPAEDPAQGEVARYFADARSRVLRINQQVEHFRELLNSVLDVNMTQVGIRQNEDMRKISAWAAIALLPAAVVGFFGMNFQHMPMLTWYIGWPLVAAATALVCFVLWRRFRRAGWL